MASQRSDDRYVHGHHESVLRSHRWRTAENSAAYLLPLLRPDALVLDVGCGPGTITADLARHVPRGRVLGIDPAADVIAQAVAEQSGPTVDYAVGDVQAIDEALLARLGGRPDVVHAHQVLQHLQDPVAALVAARAVVAPGGLVAARDADYSMMTWYPHVPELGDWQRLYLAVARAGGGEPDAGRRLLAWAHAAGLDDVTPSASAWCFATPDDRAWWGGLWADRVLSSRFAERALALELADRTELARLAAGWRAWAAEPDGWFAVPHGEVVCRVG